MRSDMSSIKTFSVFVLVTALLFEFTSFIATQMDLFLINRTPTLYQFSIGESIQDIAFGRTEREEWGAWHAENSSYRDSKSCFDVVMEFNEIGARDTSFANLSDQSIILLGDSFAEGYGVSESATSQYLIENELGVPLLNFGSAGHFGPLQELLIYKHYQTLPHQGLIVYVLPANDFGDNDSFAWESISQTRYRPYFSTGENPLTPYYFPTAVKRDHFIEDGIIGDVSTFIRNNLWSSNALRTLLMILRGDASFVAAQVEGKWVESYFYEANQGQQSNLILAYEAVLDLANNRDVLFVIIPGQTDISRWKNDPEPNSYKRQYWYESFMSFESRIHHDVSVLNLMDYLPENTDELFFTCDSHWNPNGNRWASDIIIHHIQANGLFNTHYGN